MRSVPHQFPPVYAMSAASPGPSATGRLAPAPKQGYTQPMTHIRLPRSRTLRRIVGWLAPRDGRRVYRARAWLAGWLDRRAAREATPHRLDRWFVVVQVFWGERWQVAGEFATPTEAQAKASAIANSWVLRDVDIVVARSAVAAARAANRQRSWEDRLAGLADRARGRGQPTRLASVAGAAVRGLTEPRSRG